jgi:hypothetical protein
LQSGHRFVISYRFGLHWLPNLNGAPILGLLNELGDVSSHGVQTVTVMLLSD